MPKQTCMNKKAEIAKTISEPLLVIVPDSEMPIEDFSRLCDATEKFLEKISQHVKAKFNILVESAVYFDGYETMNEIAEEQNGY